MERGLISVDRWSEGSQAYFLTHLHSDHTKGLSSTWKKGPLFCSRLTAKLFPFKFPGFDLKLLRVLELGSWYSVSLVSLSSGSETVVSVMAIDAHHCPGAVMYLFRGEFGRMLCTGDFRWETTGERAQIARTMLLNALKDEKVGTLYLDNTYCNPSYYFPSREVAAQQIVNIIASHPEHDVIIGIDNLGKEELLVHISRALKIKIWVWPERLQTMHLLGYRDIFTTKTSLTRVRAVPRYSFSVDTLEGLNTMRPTIGIMPSGLPWVVKPLEGDANFFSSSSNSCQNRSRWSAYGGNITDSNKPDGNLKSVTRFHEYIYSVSYSDHSCFAEILDFVKLVQPTNMRGIVSSSSCYVDPLYYLGHLCGANQQPQSLLRKRFEWKEGGEKVEDDQTKTNALGKVTALSIEAKKRGSTWVDYSSAHARRVSIRRRVQVGAKLRDADCAD